MVKQLGGMLAAAVFMAGVGLNAQSSQPAATNETVLSGCLRQGRADTTTANPKGMIYTLEVGPSDKMATSPAPEGSKSGAATPSTYALSFGESVDLSKHVNHHVQVTGKVLPKAAGATTGTEAKGQKPLPGAADQMFHVAALKMLAEKCR